MMRLPALLFIAICYSVCACQASTPPAQDAGLDTIPDGFRTAPDKAIPGNFSAQEKLRFDSTRIGRFLASHDSLAAFRRNIQQFYRNRGYAYAWFDEEGLIEQAGILYNRVLHLETEGLTGTLPYREEYQEGMERVNGNPGTAPDTDFELLQTGLYFYYAHRAWSGLPESASRSMEWMLPRKKKHFDILLDSIIQATEKGDTIREPVHRQYLLLRSYLKRFRDIEQRGTWITIRADKRKYQLGDTATVIRQVRRKLHLAGDLPEDNGKSVFDSALFHGLRKYQQRYGLAEDGVIGTAVIRQMNVPISSRIRQIMVNMERARWLEDDPPGNRLVVNIPQFKLLVFENDKLAWDCNVIVGKEIHKTAVFQGRLQTIVFSPYWNVPPGILNKEVLPALRRDPGYLERHHMEWHGNGIRQKPGPDNALGLVKFLFPNSYNIYLHDTPTKSLFKEPKRTFSHGCVRVSEARRLALYLLRNDPEWPAYKVDNAMQSGRERFVRLNESLPVSIVYFTAWVDGEGRIHFRDDVYNRDARLAGALFAKK
jgi:murein L,D-transpeptidase YcbB/YkuD